MTISKIPRITLKAVRVNAGMTQKESAKKLGIARETLQKYESGKTIPGWDTIKMMEEIYSFPADYFLFKS